MNVNVPAPASTSLLATGFQGEVRRIDGRFDERPVSYTHLTLPTICSV